MKTIFITGASAGFGKAIAKNLAQQNCKLILTARNEKKLREVCHEITTSTQSQVLPLIFDVRDADACEKAIRSIPTDFQSIDVLINNAGLAVELDPIHEGKLEDWNRMIDTNIKGILHITRLIAPQMVERRAGHIINIGSISSREVYAGGGVYCATKHAVLALSQAMRTDFLPYGIKVTQVAPGAAKTEFSMVRFHGDTLRADKVYDGYEPLCADDVAQIVEFILSRPPHVCINEIIFTPTAQFNGTIIRKTVE